MKAPDLVAVLGPDLARVVAATFGGMKHDIPSIKAIDKELERDPGILAHFEKMLHTGSSGETAYALAATKYHMSVSQVRRIVAKERLKRCKPTGKFA